MSVCNLTTRHSLADLSAKLKPQRGTGATARGMPFELVCPMLAGLSVGDPLDLWAETGLRLFVSFKVFRIGIVVHFFKRLFASFQGAIEWTVSATIKTRSKYNRIFTL